jgi:PTS system nitrogen regulatory IIA component
MKLADHLPASRVVALEGTTKEQVLTELVDLVAKAEEVADRDALLRAIFDREAILSTGIGLGIAVPHAKLDSVDGFVLGLGVSRSGVDFDALDGKPAHLIVLIAAPEGRQREYLGLLAQVTMNLKDTETRRSLVEAADSAEIHRLLMAAARRRS